MADERIEVEWIATANKMVQVLDRLENKFENQERQLQKLTSSSKNAADAAAGSFNALEQELKQAEAALKGLAMGTAEFQAQKQKVDELRDSVAKAKTTLATMKDAGEQAAAVLVGSFDAMEQELKQAEAALRRMKIGSDEFKQQRALVDGLRQSLSQAKNEMTAVADSTEEAAQVIEGSFNAIENELKQAENALRQLQVGTDEFDQQRQKVDALRQSLANVRAQMSGVAKETLHTAGSFNALEQELRQAEQQLSAMAIGTKEFEQQKQVVNKLHESVAQAKGQLASYAKEVQHVSGSINAMESELEQAENALRKLTVGTQAFTAQKQKVDALRDSLKQAKGQMQQAGGGFGQTLSAGVGQIQNMVAGMFTLQAVVSAISSELEKVSQLRLEAAEQSRTFEDAVRRMTLNVGAENAPRAQQMVLQQAPLLGVDPSGLADMIGAAISGGAKDVEEAMRLSSDVLKLTAGNVQDAMPILSGMLTIAGATGNRDFQAIMGQLSQFQAAGRGGDLAQTINNLSTSLAAVNTRGERIQALGSERTLELAATISQILQDERGAITGTTLRQLMQRMDMFVARPETKLDDGTVSRLTKAQVEGFNQLGTLDDRIAAMRATPELAKQFLSTLEINEGTAAIRQIVTGDVNALQEEQKAAALIGGQAAGKQEFEQLTGQIADQTKLSRAQAKSEAVARVGQIQGGRSEAGQVASTIAELFKTVNLPGIDMITSRAIEAQILAREQIGQSPAQAAIETLQGALLGPEQSRRMAAGMPTMEMSAADKDQVVKQIKVLEDLRAEFAAMRQQPLKVQAPPMRPKEAPLPAATAP